MDCWSMVTPEEEPLILKQFLRFGETRAIVGRMSPQHLRSSVPHSLAGEDSVSSILLLQRKRSCHSGWPLRQVCSVRGVPASSPQLTRPSFCPLYQSGYRPASPAQTGLVWFLCSWWRLFQEVFPVRTPGQHLYGGPDLHHAPSPPPPPGSPAAGQKGRVSCGVCGKSFYDKGRMAGSVCPLITQEG